MKPGDKVWVYMDGYQGIEEVTVVDSHTFHDHNYTIIRFDDGIRCGGFIAGLTVFPTREALCEHYRKIFE